MVIARIISGGQTGVDVAALRAAKSRGIPTGGIMPKGCRTLAGPKFEWAAEFGLHEHVSPAYPPRTYDNVRNADITIRIAVDFNTAGERCTKAAIDRYWRPQFDVPLRRWRGGYGADEAHIFAAADKIREVAATIARDVVVNFAGNSERTAPGIEAFAEGVIKMIIDAAEGL